LPETVVSLDLPELLPAAGKAMGEPETAELAVDDELTVSETVVV